MSALHNRAAEIARRRELRRAVLLSAGLHVVIGGAFYFAPPLIPSSTQLPGIITVDLVALPAMAGAAAPRAAPAPAAPVPEIPPAPEPPPKPPPPSKREVVIPEQSRKEPKPKPKPKEPPKPKDPPKPPQARPEPPPTAPDPDVPEYDDLLAQLRAERGESAPTQTADAADAAARAAAPGGGGSTQVSAEVARWLRQADRHVKRFWVVPLGLQDAPLVVHLDVKLSRAGGVEGEPRVTKRSGNPWFDEGAVRAVQKASPLPPPPEAGTWQFVFRPEDLE